MFRGEEPQTFRGEGVEKKKNTPITFEAGKEEEGEPSLRSGGRRVGERGRTLFGRKREKKRKGSSSLINWQTRKGGNKKKNLL